MRSDQQKNILILCLKLFSNLPSLLHSSPFITLPPCRCRSAICENVLSYYEPGEFLAVGVALYMIHAEGEDADDQVSVPLSLSSLIFRLC